MHTIFRLAILMLLTLMPLMSVIGEETQPSAVTTQQKDIPEEELRLLLQPLNKAELLIEADAWSGIVKEKAREIALADIQLRRKTAPEATSDASETETGIPTNQQRLVQLREQRTRLIDNLNTVINALEKKTHPEDGDTQSKIRDYRLYISAVSGINLDVSDTSATWTAIQGWLTSSEGGLRWLKNLAIFIGIILVARFLAGISKRIARKTSQRLKMPALLADFVTKGAGTLVMLIGILMALAALEISVAPLLAMVGAAGFIVAFAMQDSLSNFAAGLMILLYRPFDIGNVINAAGVTGKVETMNLVSTSVRTPDNQLVIVPNAKIWSDIITNVTGVSTRRVDMVFGIGYSDNTDQAQQILEEIVAAHPKVLESPEPVIRLNELADSSVNFVVRPWATPADYWDVYWDITSEVKKRFDAANIGIPFPQQDVHLHIADPASLAHLKP
jgi:small conductance mechanosensitive channel